MLAARVRLNPLSGHFTCFETGLPTASCSALLCPTLFGSLFVTASLRSPENSPQHFLFAPRWETLVPSVFQEMLFSQRIGREIIPGHTRKVIRVNQ